MTRAIALILFLAWAGVALGGCAGAQPFLSGQASALVTTRELRTAFYSAENDRCSASPDLAAYDVCMERARAVARAADAYREALEAAQAALRAGSGDGDRAVPCAVEAGRRLVAALLAAGLEVPRELREIASYVPARLCE